MIVHCSSQFTLPAPLGNTSSHRELGNCIKDQMGNIIHPVYNSAWSGASAGMDTVGDELMDSHQRKLAVASLVNIAAVSAAAGQVGLIIALKTIS